jgi:DMSO reductase anchor subunit
MPDAGQTLSTTRITLPARTATPLEKVDIGTLRPEHPHWSLVWMTSLIQLSVGTLVATVLTRRTDPALLTLVLTLTAFTLNISVLHLGRPAYAWRALKMWRRSWLSREVLLFGLFFASLTTLTGIAWLRVLHVVPVSTSVFSIAQIATALFGIGGILASARIYLVPARPAWNMRHTPVDFLLSSAVLGTIATTALNHIATALSHLPQFASFVPSLTERSVPAFALILITALWMVNHIVRAVVLHHSDVYERRAAASLLNTEALRGTFLVSFAFLSLALFLALTGQPLLAVAAALAGVVASRYLFFVSVVPLNMALTFIRQVHA